MYTHTYTNNIAHYYEHRLQDGRRVLLTGCSRAAEGGGAEPLSPALAEPRAAPGAGRYDN